MCMAYLTGRGVWKRARQDDAVCLDGPDSTQDALLGSGVPDVAGGAGGAVEGTVGSDAQRGWGGTGGVRAGEEAGGLGGVVSGRFLCYLTSIYLSGVYIYTHSGVRCACMTYLTGRGVDAVAHVMIQLIGWM